MNSKHDIPTPTRGWEDMKRQGEWEQRISFEIAAHTLLRVFRSPQTDELVAVMTYITIEKTYVNQFRGSWGYALNDWTRVAVLVAREVEKELCALAINGFQANGERKIQLIERANGKVRVVQMTGDGPDLPEVPPTEVQPYERPPARRLL